MRIEAYDKEVQALNKELLEKRANMSEELFAICNKLVKKAKEVGDVNLLGYAYYYLADSYYLLSTEYKKFNTNLLKAIEYLQSCGDNEHLARCYNLLGIDALNHGNSEIALDFYLTGLKYCDGLGSGVSIPGFIEFNIGQIYFDHGDTKQALQYIKAAYRDIRKNRTDSLYKRNLLFCYCFQADCYMLLGKRSSVEKCLQSIDQMEQDPDVNADLFLDLPILDIRMRGYHFLGDKNLFEKYADILSRLVQTNKYPLDSMEDIFGMCRFFMKIGRVGEVKRIVKNTERSLNDLNIPNLKKGHAKLKIELYEKLGKEEEINKAYREFYEASIEQQKDSYANYKFFLDIRNRLSQIEQENSMLIKQAETDSLTGLGNRYRLNKYADTAFDQAFSLQRSLAVEILDVDNFKNYNDSYGHPAGDQCLKMISEAITKLGETGDSIHAFRYGGDEFVIIYENMTDDEIMKYATGLRDTIASFPVGNKKGELPGPVTISQGIRNSIPSETNKLWDYMYAADNALYEVKDHKKGEVVLLHKAVISQKSLDEAQHS